MKPMKHERIRVDIDPDVKLIIDDMIERGFFKDSQEVIASALSTLQIKMAESTYTGEYDDEVFQTQMDHLQLKAE
jgi:Arc/MetJ-type ribon-helix-helix transcriptional regulator